MIIPISIDDKIIKYKKITQFDSDQLLDFDLIEYISIRNSDKNEDWFAEAGGHSNLRDLIAIAP